MKIITLIVLFISVHSFGQQVKIDRTTTPITQTMDGDLYLPNDMTVIGDMSNYAGITADGNTTETDITLKNSWFKFSEFDSDSPERSSDGDYTSGNITISLTGNYEGDFNASGESVGMNKSFEFRIFELLAALIDITDATQANPVVITAPGHTFNNGDKVAIKVVVGMIELNDRVFIVQNVSGNTFKLMDDGNVADAVAPIDIDGTGFTLYTSGGTVQRAIQTSIHSPRTFGAASGNFGSYSGSDFVNLNANCTLEYYIKCISDAPSNFIQRSCVLKVKKLGI